MKTLKSNTFIVLAFLCLPSIVKSQDLDIPRASSKARVSQHIGVTNIDVSYCRPGVKSRKIFGELIPFGKVWRTGANEATVISFNHDIEIEGVKISAGKYGLFTIPGKDKWTVILNRDWNQWGAYHYNAEKDVLRVDIELDKNEFTELFTISFTDVDKTQGKLELAWENIRVAILITTDTQSNTLEEIGNITDDLRSNWYVYSAAAQYHFYKLKNVEEAHRIIDVAIALEAPNPAPWMLKSQIFEFEKNYKEAIEQAKLALKVCKLHDYAYEIHENEAQIKKWKALMNK